MTVAYLILLIAFVDNFAMLPTVAPYADGLGARLTGVGVAVGAYSVTNLVSNVVGGVLLDRVGRRRLVVGSLLAVSATMLCYPLVASLEGLVAVRLLHGVGAYGLFLAAFSLGLVVVPPLGGALADTSAVLSPFIAGLAVCLAGMAAALTHGTCGRPATDRRRGRVTAS